jgi:penicillin-insensitive murein endopeptidase
MKETLVLFLFLAVGAARADTGDQALFRLWQKATSPAPGKPESIGSYSAGCLLGAKKLEWNGAGFSIMHPSRKRYYGHPELLAYLRDLGKKAQKAGLPRVLIGDMGRPRGGPMISGHASHQVGLDVDIWYRLSRKVPSARQREHWGSPKLVTEDGALAKGWGKAQRELVALAASSDLVERIFVHASIKRDLCRAYSGASWLYKLRPWWGHADHLHVRLACPADSPHCEHQDPVKDHDPQCGKELDWWFTQEARDEWSKKSAAIGRVFPKLPSACEPLVQEYETKGGKPAHE